MTEPTHALATKSRIGYLPEERGLYEDMTLLDTLLFLCHLEYLTGRRPWLPAPTHSYSRETVLSN
jgi:ABC-type uncharacterized transport system ATPase subunit